MPDLAFSTAEAHRVLVVEDEYIVAIDLVTSLEDVGIEVVGPAGSLDEALELLHTSGRLDAAILDINVRNQLIYPVADALASRGVPHSFALCYGATLPETGRHEKVDPLVVGAWNSFAQSQIGMILPVRCSI